MNVIKLLSCKRFQKVPFTPSTLTRLADGFKFIQFGESFQKAPFSVTKTKMPMTQAASIFLQWNKHQRVECIQMQN